MTNGDKPDAPANSSPQQLPIHQEVSSNTGNPSAEGKTTDTSDAVTSQTKLRAPHRHQRHRPRRPWLRSIGNEGNQQAVLPGRGSSKLQVVAPCRKKEGARPRRKKKIRQLKTIPVGYRNSDSHNRDVPRFPYRMSDMHYPMMCRQNLKTCWRR